MLSRLQLENTTDVLELESGLGALLLEASEGSDDAGTNDANSPVRFQRDVFQPPTRVTAIPVNYAEEAEILEIIKEIAKYL